MAAQAASSLVGMASSRAKTLTVPSGRTPEARAVESIRHVAEAVEHFIEGAVAAGGDDDLEALADGIGGEPARIPGGGGVFEGALRSDVVEVTAEAPGFVASGRWIEDDARPHAAIVWGDGRG